MAEPRRLRDRLARPAGRDRTVARERTPARERPGGRDRGPYRGRALDQPRERGLRLPRLDPEAFGRLSEAIARFMGTARFLVYMTVFIGLWLLWNSLAPAPWRFDPYTFTFLTLLLSLQASYAAPLILLAQNRQADRDRLSMEEDRRRAAMQKADTEYLAREIAALRIAIGDVATRDFVRSELNRLIDDLQDSAGGGGPRRHKGERRMMRQTELEMGGDNATPTRSRPRGKKNSGNAT